MRPITESEWKEIVHSLEGSGYVIIPQVFTEEECATLKSKYPQENLYRNVINMERYRFGRGEYKYFNYPLPELIDGIRKDFYRRLAPVANTWMNLLGIEKVFPATHNALIEHCHQSGQHRPTPLILRYETGGYNTLHQDLYGEVYFPFQTLFLLSSSGDDFKGGEFVLVEQVPRAQSKAIVLKLNRGDGLVFTTNFRPVKGTKGYYRATMKHGISAVTEGVRFALGVIFHDAK
jgi:uncharacterized protein